jgi:uracil phosphoribosyltransferase
MRDHPREQRILVAKVVVDERLAHACLSRHAAHRQLRGSDRGNLPNRRVEDSDDGVRFVTKSARTSHGANGCSQRAALGELLLLATAGPLKHHRESKAILRHECGLPAAAAALVQQIGERVLVIVRVTRQTKDHRLVFFHSREISSFPAMDTTPAFPTLRIVSHPLIQHKLTILRDRGTPTKIFKELVDEIAMLMAYEATNDLVLEPTPVDTPLESTVGQRVSGKKLTLVPILRAGLGMVEGIYRLVPGARVGHIGLYRNHDTLEPVDYYFKVPGDAAERDFFLLDPMLATGGSAVAAVSSLKRAGATRIRFLCLVAAPEGVRRLADAHPDITVYCAALDRALNDQGYIMPGLGDAGDRLFGTR